VTDERNALGLTQREMEEMDAEELDRRVEDRLDDEYEAGHCTDDEYTEVREGIVQRRLSRARWRHRRRAEPSHVE
jgi:hypothetical protein